MDDLSDLVGVTLSGSLGKPWTYRVERELGAGAVGIVFFAMRLSHAGEDPVVIKMLRPSVVAHTPELAWLALRKESVALDRLNERAPPTPFVVRLLDAGEVDRGHAARVPWLALEYVHGGPLGTTLAARVAESVTSTGFSLSPGRAKRLLGCVVEGLTAIHEVGVVHRDVKPSNVLVCGLSGDELAKVADLGLARAQGMQTTFAASVSVGSIGYSAPELRSGKGVGPRSDVFSAAALAYFMLTGEPMFPGTSMSSLSLIYRGVFEPLASKARLHPLLRASGALSALDEVLRKATRRDPAARTSSARALFAELEPLFSSAALGASMAEAQPLPGKTKTLLMTARDAPWEAKVRHRSTSDRVLRAAAFDPDGHGLAVGESGLLYWEGSTWIPLVSPPGVFDGGIRTLARLGPGRWLATGDGGEVSVFTIDACEMRQRIGRDDLCLTLASVRSARAFAVAGRISEGGFVAYAFARARWLGPFMLPRGVDVASLLMLDARTLLAAGTGPTGEGALLRVSMDTGAVTNIEGHFGPLRGLCVGEDGSVVCVGKESVAVATTTATRSLRVPRGLSFDVVAVAKGGDPWAAGAGGLFRCSLGDGGLVAAWSEPGWRAPFVGIAAFAGLCLAASADGSIVSIEQGGAGRG